MDKCIELSIKTGESLEGVRHVSGLRRSRLPVPDCPCCEFPMFCIFSIDGTDDILNGSPLPSGNFDHDLFVCVQGCYAYQAGYFSRVLANGEVELVFFHEGPGHPTWEILEPYPVAPLVLSELPPMPPPDITRSILPGYYHRISPVLLWGTEWSGGYSILGTCPFCSGQMKKVATIDSDENIRLVARVKKKLIIETYLMWGDLSYLGVTICSSCRAFGYRMMI